MGNCCASRPEDNQDGLNEPTHADQLIATEDLPPGWKAVPSRSRPGKVAYQNVHTGERISWIPTDRAETFKGAIKSKKKKKKTGAQNNTLTQEKARLVNNEGYSAEGESGGHHGGQDNEGYSAEGESGGHHGEQELNPV